MATAIAKSFLALRFLALLLRSQLEHDPEKWEPVFG
jgi:hypothetical protein